MCGFVCGREEGVFLINRSCRTCLNVFSISLKRDRSAAISIIKRADITYTYKHIYNVRAHMGSYTWLTPWTLTRSHSSLTLYTIFVLVFTLSLGFLLLGLRFEECWVIVAGWRMVLIDQRNHGASASLPVTAPHDIPAAAKDMADLLKAEGWDMPNVMIAHSLGGKVVLDFLQKAAAGSYGSVVLPKQVIRLLLSASLKQLSNSYTCLYVNVDAKTIHTNMNRLPGCAVSKTTSQCICNFVMFPQNHLLRQQCRDNLTYPPTHFSSSQWYQCAQQVKGIQLPIWVST